MITRGRKRRLSPQDEADDNNDTATKRTRGKRKLVASDTPVLRSSRIAARSTPSALQIDVADATPTTTKTKARRKPSLQESNDAEAIAVPSPIPSTAIVNEKTNTEHLTTRKRKRKHKQQNHPLSSPSSPTLPPPASQTRTTSPTPSSKSIPSPQQQPQTPTQSQTQTPRVILSVKKNKPGRPAKRVKRGRTKKQPQEVVGALLDEASFYRTFGHKLTESEANTVRGAPSDKDKEVYHMAKKIAESKDKRISRSSSPSPHSTTTTGSGGNGETVPAPPKIDKIQFGNYLIDTWYVAPYPAEYSQYPILYFCEYCLKYMNSSFVAGRHKMKCTAKHPPGDEIYRDGQISVFEVDGRKNKIYCQNLCLLGKMFIDHKTLYYDVEPFLFYIMTEVDEQGCHIVGYFSKEKRSMMNYNVSCILTLPIHQRKGYGQYLIDFSYLLTKKEEGNGSPEKPLSNLGLLSYRKYWKDALFRQLQNQEEAISIEELSFRTGMTADDVTSTLQLTGILKEDPKLEGEGYMMAVDQETIDKHINKVKARGLPQVDPTKLTWTPYVLSRERLVALTSATTTPTTATHPAVAINTSDKDNK
ncbi:acyl-CoA N-acyltransferase [Zychaea mexicana]|uniref:acyl-CoA N-acyltransferase n=1 Tax=Zychaea mexicana TaxID=64656 RepID=UPI0022FF140E|nr:acyl-CoA N-acyltransferase [Zychaea mexicana]KAI9490880.1 acyl-CoA N-acyltransferase [Zychaea mexicana]